MADDKQKQADAVELYRAQPAPIIAVPVLEVERAVEEWARMKATPAWLFKAAAVGARWECGPQVAPCIVSESAYDSAVAFAENPHAVVNAPNKG